MTHPLRIVDTEAHVIEPAEMWAKYVEPAFRERAPAPSSASDDTARRELDPQIRARLLVAAQRAGVDPDKVMDFVEKPPVNLDHVLVEGRPILEEVGLRIWAKSAAESFTPYVKQNVSRHDSASHLKSFREHGIERSFLYPTTGLALFAVKGMDPALDRALVRAYNQWLKDFCSLEPEVLRGVGAVCRQDPEAMIQELERVHSWGWKAVTLRSAPVNGRSLAHPSYEKFWSRCEELDMAVGLHEAAHTLSPAGGEEHFDTHFSMHACSHPVGHMLGFLTLIEGGVLERHPKLRVGFLESGCGWLSYWLWRLDTSYAESTWEVSENVKMKPSDYFRRQCFITCEPGEPGIETVINVVGEGCVVFGTDYPHLDHPPRAREDAIMLAERLTPRLAKKLLWDNACRFYGLSP